MRGNESLEYVFRALSAVGGYFVLEAADGEEYIIAHKEEWLGSSDDIENALQTSQETQLPLRKHDHSVHKDLAQSDAEETVDDMLDTINRTIAVFNLEDTDEASDEEDTEEDAQSQLPPPRRVRFEAIRGDLPPELQE